MTGPRPAEPRWTEREEKELLEMLNAGKTAVEISREPKRTPGGAFIRDCSAYIEGNGLTRRASRDRFVTWFQN